MLKKSDVQRIVSKTFDDTKAAGVKKIRLRAAYSFSGLSKQNIQGITNNEAKYRKFNTKFMNKTVPSPVRTENVFSHLQIDLVNMRNQLIEYENKVYQYILSIMDVFSRFHWLIPLERKFPRHIKLYLEKLFIEHGPPKRLQSDRGKKFKKEVKEVT